MAQDLVPPSDHGNFSLTDLFTQIMGSKLLPGIWHDKDLWFDRKILTSKQSRFNNWQSPYTTTILELDRESYDAFEKFQSVGDIKEIASLAARFSLYNDKVTSELHMLKRVFVYESLGFYVTTCDEQGRQGPRIKNYSHHSDLFYTMGRRGAVAASPAFNSNPSYFVLPTLVNLIEILRSRWHLGSIVNLKLDDLLERISHVPNIADLEDQVFQCKILFGLFLKNPTPYLFDGGAITEIAEAGEKTFWIERLRVEMASKFWIMDKLVNDLYNRRRF
jgi:hypothetical protein